MNAGQQGHPTRLEYIAAYATPHPWLWVLVPSGFWAILYLCRESLDEAVYIALRSTIVLALASSVISVCLQLFGVRPAPKNRHRAAQPPDASDSTGSRAHDSAE